MNNENIVLMSPEDFEELKNGNKAKLKAIKEAANNVNKAKTRTGEKENGKSR